MYRILQQLGDGLRLGDGTPECLAHWLLFVTKNGDQKSQSLLKGKSFSTNKTIKLKFCMWSLARGAKFRWQAKIF